MYIAIPNKVPLMNLTTMSITFVTVAYLVIFVIVS